MHGYDVLYCQCLLVKPPHTEVFRLATGKRAVRDSTFCLTCFYTHDRLSSYYKVRCYTYGQEHHRPPSLFATFFSQVREQTRNLETELAGMREWKNRVDASLVLAPKVRVGSSTGHLFMHALQLHSSVTTVECGKLRGCMSLDSSRSHVARRTLYLSHHSIGREISLLPKADI